MKNGGASESLSNPQRRWFQVCWAAWLAALLSLLVATAVKGDPKLDTSDPLGFFTNLSSRLLQSELNLSLTRIQVWPTNQYTPAAHRLLQVTVNLLDATTNRFNDTYPFLPSVFRPVFQREGDQLFIVGYRSVEQVNLPSDPVFVKPIDPGNSAEFNALPEGVVLPINVYGVPWIIGAKKGWPNFNEFAMQSVFQITRRLEIQRPSLTAPRSTWRTNMMYIVGISNAIGVELWNSYRSNFNRAVDIYVTDDLTMSLTNNFWPAGIQTSMTLLPSTATGFVSIPSTGAEQWRGFTLNATNSFLVAMWTNVVFLPYMPYRHNPPGFTTNPNDAWDTSQTFPQLQWGMAITNNLRVLLVDVTEATNKWVIDYVHLRGLNGIRDLSGEIRDQDNSIGFDGLWSTNLISGFLPQGILNQIDVSLGNQGGTTTDWTGYGLGQPTGATKDYVIDYFRAFFGLSPLRYPGIVNTNLVMQVPLSPTKRNSQYLTWQANDPLVHHMSEEIAQPLGEDTLLRHFLKAPVQLIKNIGRLNEDYQPWGGNPNLSGVGGGLDPLRFDLAFKDPLVRNSDDWKFPDSESLSSAILGRIHRGTPWQTVYLKSADVELADWTNWTGNPIIMDAARSAPTNDWRLVSLIVSLLNTNNPRQLRSVNERNTNAWLAVQDGLSALTNSSTDAELNSFIPQIKFDTLTASSNSPQAAIIGEALADKRASLPGQNFRRLGDILSTPELSVASPWLNLSSAAQLQKGITDEAYERIPAQLLPLLRTDSIGSVIQTDGMARIEFTGFDDYPYAIEISTNLVDWMSVSTNYPTNGVFEFVEPAVVEGEQRFYRSMLLP